MTPNTSPPYVHGYTLTPSLFGDEYRTRDYRGGLTLTGGNSSRGQHESWWAHMVSLRFQGRGAGISVAGTARLTGKAS